MVMVEKEIELLNRIPCYCEYNENPDCKNNSFIDEKSEITRDLLLFYILGP